MTPANTLDGELQKQPDVEIKASPTPSHDDNAKDSATPMTPTTPTGIKATRTVSTLVQEPDAVVSKTVSPVAPIPEENRPVRPGLPRRRTTAQTRYIDMLLELDTIPRIDNLGAVLFTWILLAGYIVFPATFSKFQSKLDLNSTADDKKKEIEELSKILRAVGNVPLLYVAACTCGIGIAGCLWLWWKHRRNYVWVINRIFLPALMNSIAGIISSMVGIYGTKNGRGQLSITAKVTIGVTGACTVVASALFLIYNSIMLAMTKKKHARETREVQESLYNNQASIEEQSEKRGQVARERFGHHEVLGIDPGRVV